MKSIFTVLQDIEKLIYKVLMWVVLIPKTIYKIVTNPTWAHDYIKKELDENEEKKTPPFDEFMSPVILLLVVALIPALIFNSLPTFGGVITSPAEEKPTTDRALSFESTTEFLSASPGMKFVHVWTVEKYNEDGLYNVIDGESHFSDDVQNFTEKVDNRTVKDRFLTSFSDAGEYYVNVYAGKYDPQQGVDHILESHTTYIKVVVPLKTEEQVVISNDVAKSQASVSEGQTAANLTDQIQKERTLFLALGLMMPPLLFAFAIKAFPRKKETKNMTDDEKDKWISENTLRDHFYAQCYFFSPLSLAIWATYYSSYFYTSDAYFYWSDNLVSGIILLPAILAGIWFFRIEMKTIQYECKTGPIPAFFTVLFCLLLLGSAALIIFFYKDVQDNIRQVLIQLYPVIAIFLIGSFFGAWYQRRKAENKTITWRNLSWVAIGTAAMLFFWKSTSLVPSSTPELTNASTQVAVVSSGQDSQIPESPFGNLATPLASIVDVTSTPSVGQPSTANTATLALDVSPEASATAVVGVTQETAEAPTATQAPIINVPTAADQRYYVEEFNGPVNDWLSFMTFGDPRMVQNEVDFGKLSISLDPLEDKYAWFYLINNDYSYTDVKVDAVVTNQGNNANGISLICRYSDIGWYEFVVSSSGTYKVFVVDNQGVVNSGYNELAYGGSEGIKTGFQTNTYGIVCKENQLTLLVNNKEEIAITDRRFKLPEGKIGIAVSSPLKLPVHVDFETLTVSQP